MLLYDYRIHQYKAKTMEKHKSDGFGNERVSYHISNLKSFALVFQNRFFRRLGMWEHSPILLRYHLKLSSLKANVCSVLPVLVKALNSEIRSDNFDL